NGDDRRARELYLTAKGKALWQRLRPKTSAANERVLAPLAPAQRELFLDLLIRLIEGNRAYGRPGAGRRKRGSQGASSGKQSEDDMPRIEGMARALAVTALSALILSATPSNAQPWPQRTVRVIVPLPPGIPTDLVCRLFADRLSERWRQPVVVENRQG